jgi:hypothetical protein
MRRLRRISEEAYLARLRVELERVAESLKRLLIRIHRLDRIHVNINVDNWFRSQFRHRASVFYRYGHSAHLLQCSAVTSGFRSNRRSFSKAHQSQSGRHRPSKFLARRVLNWWSGGFERGSLRSALVFPLPPHHLAASPSFCSSPHTSSAPSSGLCVPPHPHGRDTPVAMLLPVPKLAIPLMQLSGSPTTSCCEYRWPALQFVRLAGTSR